MKISIITVVLNNEKTIAAAIQSVTGQTYGNIEHIIVDGGSTDGTLEIIEQIRPSKSLLISEPDKGIYDAMNKGIALATGDVIGILNADDLYANESILETVAQIMEEGPLDMLYGDVSFFKPENPDRVVRRYSSKRFKPDKIAYGWMPAHPAIFVQRNIFEKIGYYRIDYKIAGDFEFIARIFSNLKPRYHYLPEVFVKMCIGGISTSGWRNTILLNREVLKACRDNGINTNIMKILSKYPAKVLEYCQR